MINHGWFMENMDRGLAVPKRPKIPQMPQKLSAKSLGLWWKKASLGVHSPWMIFLIGRVKQWREKSKLWEGVLLLQYIFFTKQAERRISTRNKNHRKILTNGRVCKYVCKSYIFQIVTCDYFSKQFCLFLCIKKQNWPENSFYVTLPQQCAISLV